MVCSFIFPVFLSFIGCRRGMEDQPKLKAMTASDFFTDGRSARQPVAGTVARGHFHDDELMFDGKTNGRDAAVFPFPVTKDVLARGQERYDIFCAVCHDRAGTGNGIVVQRGFPKPASFHSDALRKAPVGRYFDVITNGQGTMYSFGDRIDARDRWAIIAYIRALQLSQNATLADVPPDERGRLQ
jgi:cytochrome c553